MLPGVTVTSANDDAQSRRSEPRLAERLERTREEELETGLRELVAIARDRWQR